LQTKAKKCIHHWNIEIANGPVSDGVCENCGMKKEFQNSIFSEARHITLEKEHAPETQAIDRKWNRWFGD